MNIPLGEHQMGEHRIRLIALGVTIVLLVIAACAQQPILSIMPIPVTAQPPATLSPPSPTQPASTNAVPLALTPAPNVQIVRETVVVTATPNKNSTPSDSAGVAAPCKRNGLNTEDEVVIGALYPLSNPAMMLNGFAMQAATNIAVTEINLQGGIHGKPLRIISYDSASDPAQGAQFAERLITIDCVAAIIGVFHSDVALAVKAIAVQYHIPVIFADPYAEEITVDQQPEIFRIAPLRTVFTEMMGKWLAEVGDYNHDQMLHAVVLADNSRYGQLRIERAKELLPNYGITVDCITVNLPTTDFSPVIARIVALERMPDAIFFNLQDEAILPLHQQLIDAGISPTRDTLIVSTAPALNSPRYWEQVPEGNYGIVLQIGPWPTTVPPFGKKFADKFYKLFERWPEAVAFEAYDATWLIADAMTRANSLEPDKVIAALEETDITLASGHYTFPYGTQNRPDGINIPFYLWHQWLEPQLLYLQYTEPNQQATDAAVIWPPTYRTIKEALVPDLLDTTLLVRR